ncbi:ROK family transcriptional regulator [Anaerolineae bacterium CFX9]|nr:ROK family transcriptional regulator [Anaerolineae bacterium CFX9]
MKKIDFPPLGTPIFPASQSISANAPFHLLPPQAKAIAILRRQGPLSRTEIADYTGYSRSTITTTINQLTDLGIIEEIGDGETSGGRRPRMLNFKADFGYVVGVDVGATSVDCAIADFSRHILASGSREIDVREGPEVTLTIIRDMVMEALKETGISPEKIYGFGIGVPGPVDFAAGVLIAPPIMPGWNGYPIREFIRETFTQAVVVVDNDVNVMALGELRYGAGMLHENFIFVKVGTGIGAGIVAKGAIYRGADGCAGDIGHICADRSGPICHCGNIGCLEAIAAGPAIAARATEAMNAGKSAIFAKYAAQHNGILTAVDVGRAASEGDPVANQIIHESGRFIGEVLATLVNFFNPSMILIGGGVSNIGHQFLAAIRRGVLHRSLPLSTRHLRIDISPMGAQAGVFGAIALAMEHVFAVEGE